MVENEFEEFKVEEDAPSNEFSDVPDTGQGSQDELIAAGSAGQVYDWSNAPTGTKAPPRVEMDGKEVIVKKAEIIIPPADREWTKSRAGTSEYKYCTFTLHYDYQGQQEFYSGIRVFKRVIEGKDKYSHPTIMRDRKNQASKLLGIYADYKEKDINEVSLKEFMNFLNSQPKVIIKAETVKNPTTNQEVTKNLVGSFVK